MNLRILFGVITVFEIIPWSISKRTPQEVIENFEPAFEKVHNEFKKHEINIKIETEPIFDDVTLAISKQNESFNLTLAKARIIIKNTVWEVLEDTGMINHQDKITHCITTLNRTENFLIAQALGGQRICVKIALDQYTTSSIFVQKLLTELGNEHYIVDVIKEECGKVALPFDVQECLIKDLYLYYPNYLKDVAKEINYRMSIVEENMEKTIKEFYKCYLFLEEEITEMIADIFVEFIACVMQNKP